jgi:hypothetical protein
MILLKVEELPSRSSTTQDMEERSGDRVLTSVSSMSRPVESRTHRG